MPALSAPEYLACGAAALLYLKASFRQTVFDRISETKPEKE